MTSLPCMSYGDLLELINDLNSVEQPVREEAYALLVAWGEPVVPHLIERFPDIAGAARLSVIRALGEIGDVRAAPLLAELVRSRDPYEYIFVSSLAARSLGQIGAVDAVLDLLNDELPGPRRMAALVLGNMALRHDHTTQRAMVALIGALKDSDGKTQILAAQALEKIGAPEALSAVQAWRDGL